MNTQLRNLASAAIKLHEEIQRDRYEALSSGGGLRTLSDEELLSLQLQITHQLQLNLQKPTQ